MHPILVFELLILVTLANGAPVIAKKMLGDRLDAPLDGGKVLYDGKPVFGPTKTIRGIVTALLVTLAAALIMGFSWQLGLLVAAGAMAGDLFSSFAKRRMKMSSSSMAVGLDHIPESLLPLFASSLLLPVSLLDILAGTTIFCAGALLLSPLLCRLNLRDRPY
jgi:CDP-2,3-bis-(O-geranylgeranyl)-sn-glycerol synthase